MNERRIETPGGRLHGVSFVGILPNICIYEIIHLEDSDSADDMA